MVIEDLAKHFAVSISTIRNWVKSGDIPADTYVKVSSIYRFNSAKVEAALLARDDGKDVTVTQSEIEATGDELESLATTVVSAGAEDDELHSILDEYEKDL
jgi:predicted site-specific integrase-resolvase